MKMRLGEWRLEKLERGASGGVGTILGYDESLLKSDQQESVRLRLMEMGFLAGAEVELMHEAPFSKDPITVRIRGGLIALRRHEANYIFIEKN